MLAGLLGYLAVCAYWLDELGNLLRFLAGGLAELLVRWLPGFAAWVSGWLVGFYGFAGSLGGWLGLLFWCSCWAGCGLADWSFWLAGIAVYLAGVSGWLPGCVTGWAGSVACLMALLALLDIRMAALLAWLPGWIAVSLPG
jgi:hypothetical protein